MEMPNLPIGLEAENLLQQHGGPLILPGQKGDYVVMRADVYDAMLGMETDDEAETIASVRRGLADMEAGRMRDLDDVFHDLDSD
jgi:PHD/YefM family antitoxin component YafN of YafNO toxin-antitoxin module